MGQYISELELIPNLRGIATTAGGTYLRNPSNTGWAWGIPASFPSQGGQGGKFLTTDGTNVSWVSVSSPTGANPTASVGLNPVNGVATTFMRSDAAPPLDTTITLSWSGNHNFTFTGVASTPAIQVSGSWFSGGSGSTTLPQLLIQPTGTTSTTWPTQGTGLGLNAASAFTGHLIEGKVGGTTVSYLDYLGNMSAAGFISNSYNSTGNNQSITLQSNSFTTANTGVVLDGGAWSNSAGIAIAAAITPIFNTTSNAGWTLFRGNATVTGDTATGTKLLLQLAVGNTNKFVVDSTGTVTTGIWTGTTIAIANGGTGQITANAALNALLPSQASANGLYLTSNGTNTSWAAVSAGASGANPTGTVGLTTVNGSVSTFMRSDAAPALDVTISPTWTGTHTFNLGNVGFSKVLSGSGQASGFVQAAFSNFLFSSNSKFDGSVYRYDSTGYASSVQATGGTATNGVTLNVATTGTAGNVAQMIPVLNIAADTQTTKIAPSNSNAFGNFTALNVAPTINQSGTGSYTVIKGYATETAFNAGQTNLLLDLGIGGTQKASIDRTGLGTFVGGLSIPNTTGMLSIGAGNTTSSAPAIIATTNNLSLDIQGKSTSNRRASILFSNTFGSSWSKAWEFGTDSTATGNANFYIYDDVNAKLRFLIDSNGSWGIPNTSDNVSFLSKFDANGQYTTYGTNTTLNNLAVPAAPTITTSGTAGSTTYTYTVTAVNVQGQTIASTAGSTATGNTTLTGTNFNTITWTAVNGATSYNVYRTVGGASQGNIASVSAPTVTKNDTGLTGSGASPTNPTGTSLTVKSWAGQTNPIIVGQNSAGSNTFTVDPSGNTVGNTLKLNSGAAAAGTNTTAATSAFNGKVAGVLTGTGSATSFTFNDNLGTTSKLPIVTDSSNNAVIVDISFTSNTTVVSFNVAPANGTTYNLTVIG